MSILALANQKEAEYGPIQRIFADKGTVYCDRHRRSGVRWADGNQYLQKRVLSRQADGGSECTGGNRNNGTGC